MALMQAGAAADLCPALIQPLEPRVLLSGSFGPGQVLLDSFDQPIAVITADVDGDGDFDVIAASDQTYGSGVVWLENDGQGAFTQRVVDADAERVDALFAIDVDDDGDLDLIAGADADPTLSWYENDGSESFTRHAVANTLGAMLFVTGADVDSDGDIDLLASGENDPFAWYENDGNESFTEHIIDGALDEVRAMVAGDFDGDDDIDIAVAHNDSGQTLWYENDGDESFTQRTVPTIGLSPSDIAAADIDGDGDIDLVTVDSVRDSASWHENDGNGTFTEHRLTTALDTAVRVDVGDADNDGDLDLLVAAFGDDEIFVLENDGSQTFTVRHVAGGATPSPSFADLDGDGDLDIVGGFTDTDDVRWYEHLFGPEIVVTFGSTNVSDNDTSRSLANGTNFGSVPLGGLSTHTYTIENVGTEVLQLGAAVVVGPHAAEFVVTQQHDQVLDPGQTTTLDITFTPTVTTPRFAAITFTTNDVNENPFNFALTGRAGTPELDVFFGETPVADGDTTPSVAEGTDMGMRPVLGATTQTLTLRNTGTATVTISSVDIVGMHAADFSVLDMPDTIAPGTSEDLVIEISPLQSGQRYAGIVIQSDDADEAIYNFAIRATAFAPASFINLQTIGTFPSLDDFVVIDLDDDGDDDLLAADEIGDVIVWFENVAGVFAEHTIDGDVGDANGLSAGDVDGDGDVDFVAALFDNDAVVWYENDGSESFTQHAVGSVNNASYVLAVDLDEDGDGDVIALENGIMLFFENDGSENFTEQQIGFSGPGYPDFVAIDFDDDGDVDLLSRTNSQGSIALHENDGSENFTSSLLIDSDTILHFAVGDIDGDGDLDFATTGQDEDTGVAWYRNDGDGMYVEIGLSRIDDAQPITLADLDNDGDLDLLTSGSHLFGSSSGRYVIWFENHPGQGFERNLVEVGTSIEHAGALPSDVDGDGDLDVVVAYRGLAWLENVLGPEVRVSFDETAVDDGSTAPAADNGTDFGGVIVGESFTHAFTVENVGTDLLTLGAVQVTGTHADDFVVTMSPATEVAVGASTTLEVTFTPGALGVRTATLSFATGDDDQTPFDFAVTGVGGFPEMDVSFQGTPLQDGDTTPSLAEGNLFGAVGVGSQTSHTLTLTNPGTAALDLSGAQFVGRDAADFSLEQPLPDRVAAGAAVDLTINFAPGAAGARFAGLVISSNDADESPYNFALRGTGGASVTFSGVRFPITTSDLSNPFALDLADIDGDGDVDAVSSSGHDDLIAWFENDGDVNFTRHDIPASNVGLRVEAVDFDGDGDMDIIVGGPQVSWLENDGSESFSEHIAYTIAGAGVFDFTEIAIADIDGDDNLDIAITNEDRRAFGWLMHDGMAGFTFNAIDLPTPSVDPMDVDAIDVDGDDDVDIVLVTDGNSVFWYENDGSESFTLRATNNDARALTADAVDIDHDGDADIIATNPFADRVDLLRNNGDGTFSIVVVGDREDSFGARAIDLDGDGDLDIVTGSLDEAPAWFENDGNESFTTHVLDTNADLTWAIDTGDIDGDGDLDIAVPVQDFDNLYWFEAYTGAEIAARFGAVALPDGSGVSTELGTEFGGWEPGTNVSHTFTIENLGTAALMLGDVQVTGANAADFAVTVAPDSDVAAGGSTTLEITFTPSDVGVRTAEVSFTTNDGDEATYNFSVAGTGGFPELDVQFEGQSVPDGDTTPSALEGTLFALTAVGGSTSHSFTIHNTGQAPLTVGTPMIVGRDAGDFAVTQAPAATVAPGGSTTLTVRFAPTAVGQRYAGLVFANGDADESPFNVALRGAADVPQVEVTFNSTPLNDGDVTPSEADGTDFADVPVDSAVAHMFTVANNGSVNLHMGTLALVDRDSEAFTFASLTDSVVAPDAVGSHSAGIELDTNDPNAPDFDFRLTGNATPSIQLSQAGHVIVEGSVGEVYTADVDGDGDTDVVTSVVPEDGFDWYENDGHGNFTAHSVTTMIGDVTDIRIADLDSDGDLDIVGFDNSSELITWFVNDGDGNFTDQQLSASMYAVRDLVVTNLDGDDDMDVVLTQAGSGDLIWLENDGNESFTPTTIATTIPAPGPIDAADFDDDGDIDLTVASLTADTLHWLENDGNEAFSEHVIDSNTSDQPRHVDAVDFDGDGDIDVFVDTPQARWHGNDGSGTFTERTVLFFGSPPFQRAVDVDQDGDADIFAVGGSSPRPIIWMESDGAGGFIRHDYQRELAERLAVGDFDGDGDLDVVVRNGGASPNLSWFEQTQGPEITVQFGDRMLPDGDTSRTAINGTNFGSVVSGNSATREYTITNTGADELTLGPVQLLGAHAADFAVTGAPVGTLAAGASTTLEVTYQPLANRTSFAAVSIGNNDADEQPFNFALMGRTGVSEIDVTFNSTNLPDGDTTPSASEGTNIGLVAVGGMVSRTFTIRNAGNATLVIDSVNVVGQHASDFSITAAPAAGVLPGETTTLEVTFAPDAQGQRFAGIVIGNNDSNEDPFNFAITGQGTAAEIDVEFSGTPVVDGDTTPSVADGTDFGSVQVGSFVDHVFTIENNGADALLITGSPRVVISGTHASDFQVIAQPAASVDAGMFTTFTIRFTPSAATQRFAALRITSNDADEQVYNVSLRGTGTAVMMSSVLTATVDDAGFDWLVEQLA